ncbi:MAG: hypothetical protein ACK4MV_03515 [Beijerinckiaceae bacterium]
MIGRSLLAECVLALALACAPALAQEAQVPPGGRAGEPRAVRTAFVPLGGFGQGLLWAPPEGSEPPRAAVVLVHPHATSLGNPLCGGLAARGFLVLCADPPNAARSFRTGGYDAQALTVGAAIARARAEPGVRSVWLAGHGEGGALAAFYQNVANNGPAACQGPEKAAPCDASRLAGLPPAAGLVLVDPELGQAFATLSGLDPAIAVESAPTQRYPGLDLYDPRNGFDPGQNAGRYGAAFRKAWFAAQADRSARLAAEARKLVSAVAARERGAFADDMPMFVAGALITPIWQVDARLLARTKRAHRLLAADGSTASRVLATLAPPMGSPREATNFRAAAAFSARGFLAGHTLETTPDYDVTADDVLGVVWPSSATSTIANVAGVTEPLLIMANTGHFGVRPAEMILDAARSQDRELVGVEGATHSLTPCLACSGGSGRRYGDTLARALDYVADWLRPRS